MFARESTTRRIGRALSIVLRLRRELLFLTADDDLVIAVNPNCWQAVKASIHLTAPVPPRRVPSGAAGGGEGRRGA